MKLSVYDTKGAEIEKIDLPAIFESKINKTLLAQAVRVYLAGQRQGTSKTKTRSEVQGSTRKIYRQKGTGRARHGSIRANIFRKGGIVFGPVPRDYTLKFPQKMRKQAFASALSQKALEKSIIIVDTFEKLKDKTKEMVATLKNLKLTPDDDKLLLVSEKRDLHLLRIARNIYNTQVGQVKLLNTYQILNSGKLIFTKAAILSFGNKKEEFGKKEKPEKTKEIVKEKPAVETRRRRVSKK